MKRLIFITLLCCLQTSLFAVSINVFPTTVGRTKQAVISIDFDLEFASKDWKPEYLKYSLIPPGGDRVFCSEVVAVGKRMRFIFQINPANFVVFEKLVSDSTGYYLQNDEPIELSGETIAPGGLHDLTVIKINRIDEEAWKKYVVDEYSSEYLFSHLFKVGTPLGTGDSSKTTYFVELVQSGLWDHIGDWSMFWGIKGRWSTNQSDKLNYVQLFPLTIFHNSPVLNLAGSMGVETGYLGFSTEGRSFLKGEVEYRIPYNPIDLTLGKPRLRLKPVLDLSIQGSMGWGNVALPDSVKNGMDVNCSVRYDIPLGSVYYLQSNAEGFYSTITRDVQYRYDFSLGYIVDGSIRIAAEYKQGYQNVTYQFDKQILLGFVVDVLNENNQ